MKHKWKANEKNEEKKSTHSFKCVFGFRMTNWLMHLSYPLIDVVKMYDSFVASSLET